VLELQTFIEHMRRLAREFDETSVRDMEGARFPAAVFVEYAASALQRGYNAPAGRPGQSRAGIEARSS
jgi:hypothetical protein